MSTLMNIPDEVKFHTLIPYIMPVTDRRLVSKEVSKSVTKSDLDRIKFYNMFTDMFLSYLSIEF
mgnify:CR=1 FL=1